MMYAAPTVPRGRGGLIGWRFTTARLWKVGLKHVDTQHREWVDPLPGADQGEVIYAIECGSQRFGTKSLG